MYQINLLDRKHESLCENLIDHDGVDSFENRIKQTIKPFNGAVTIEDKPLGFYFINFNTEEDMLMFILRFS